MDYLLKRAKNNKLVWNLSKRELEHPEGAGFDLRIGEIYRLTSGGFHRVEKRNTPKVVLIGKYKKDGMYIDSELIGYYLIKIIEEIELYVNMIGFFSSSEYTFSLRHYFANWCSSPLRT